MSSSYSQNYSVGPGDFRTAEYRCQPCTKTVLHTSRLRLHLSTRLRLSRCNTAAAGHKTQRIYRIGKMSKIRTPRVCLTADPKLPFGVIDYVAVGILILGAVWLCSHNVFFLYFLLHGLPTESLLQQMMNVFLFVVTECVALVILHAQGRTPYLDRKLLQSFLSSTVGSIPKIFQIVCKLFTKSDRSRAD